MAFPEKGHRFSPAALTLDGAALDAYREAVADESLLSLERVLGEPLVPPLAVAAYALKALLEQIDLPPGSIHTGQEVSFRRVLRPGQRLEMQAQVSSASTRGGWRFVNINMTAADESGQVAMSGRATLMLLEEAVPGRPAHGPSGPAIRRVKQGGA